MLLGTCLVAPWLLLKQGELPPGIWKQAPHVFLAGWADVLLSSLWCFCVLGRSLCWASLTEAGNLEQPHLLWWSPDSERCSPAGSSMPSECRRGCKKLARSRGNTRSSEQPGLTLDNQAGTVQAARDHQPCWEAGIIRHTQRYPADILLQLLTVPGKVFLIYSLAIAPSELNEFLCYWSHILVYYVGGSYHILLSLLFSRLNK